MGTFKKALVIILSLGILGALFVVGIAFFAFALIALPIFYLYQKYRVSQVKGTNPEAEADVVVNEPGTTVIDAEFVEVKEDSKND